MPFSTRGSLLNRKGHESTVARRVIELEKVLGEPRDCRSVSRKTISQSSDATTPTQSRLRYSLDVEGSSTEILVRTPFGSGSQKKFVSRDHPPDSPNCRVPVCYPVRRPTDPCAIGQNDSSRKLGQHDVENHRTIKSSPLRKHFSMMASSTTPAITHLNPRSTMPEEPLQKSPDGFLDRQLPELPNEEEVKDPATKRITSFSSSSARVRFADPIEEPLESPSSDSTIQFGFRNSFPQQQFSPYENTSMGTRKNADHSCGAQSVNGTMESSVRYVVPNVSENADQFVDANARTSQARVYNDGAANCPSTTGAAKTTTAPRNLPYTFQELEARKPSTTTDCSVKQPLKSLSVKDGLSHAPRTSAKSNSLLAAFYGTTEIPPVKNCYAKRPTKGTGFGAEDTYQERYYRPEAKSQEQAGQQTPVEANFQRSQLSGTFEDSGKDSLQSSGNFAAVARHDVRATITNQDRRKSREKRNESFVNPQRSEPPIFQNTTSLYDRRQSHTKHVATNQDSSIIPQHYSQGEHHDKGMNFRQEALLRKPNINSSTTNIGPSRPTNKHSSMIELSNSNGSSRNAVNGPRDFLKASDHMNKRPASTLQPYSPLAAFFGTALTSPSLVQSCPRSPSSKTPNFPAENPTRLAAGETHTTSGVRGMWEGAHTIQEMSVESSPRDLSGEDVEPTGCELNREKFAPRLERASPLMISTTVRMPDLSDRVSDNGLHAHPSASSVEAPSTSSQTELSPLSVMEARSLPVQRSHEENPRSFPATGLISSETKVDAYNVDGAKPSANHLEELIESESTSTNLVVEEFSAYWSNFDLSVQSMTDMSTSGADFEHSERDRSECDDYPKPGTISPIILYANQSCSSHHPGAIEESFQTTKESFRKPSDASSSLTTFSSILGDCDLSNASTSSSAANYSHASSTHSTAVICSFVDCEPYGEVDQDTENGSLSSRLALQCLSADPLEGDDPPMDPSDCTRDFCYSPRNVHEGFVAEELDQLLDELELATNNSAHFKDDVESLNSLCDFSAKEEEQPEFNLGVFSGLTPNSDSSKSPTSVGLCDQAGIVPQANASDGNSKLKRSSRVPSRAIGTGQAYRRPNRSLSEGMILSTQLPAIYEDHTMSPEEESECFKRSSTTQQEVRPDNIQRRVSDFFMVETSSDVMILDNMIRANSPEESCKYQPSAATENSPERETVQEEDHLEPQQEIQDVQLSPSYPVSSDVSTKPEGVEHADAINAQEDYLVESEAKGAPSTFFSEQDMLPTTDVGVEQQRTDSCCVEDKPESLSIHLQSFDKFNKEKRSNPIGERIPSVTEAKREEAEVKIPKPRFEYALLRFPRKILCKILSEMNYLEFHALPQISRKMRQGLNNGEAKEVVLERFLGDVGYRTCDPNLLGQQDISAEYGRKRSSSDVDARKAHRDTVGTGHLVQRDKNYNRVKPIRSSTALVNGVAKPPSPINLNLKDLHAFYTGLEFEESELSELAEQSKHGGLDLPTLRMIRAATRAHNKILMRVRSQPESLLSRKLYHCHGMRHLGKPLAPIFTPRKPAVLRVWVPTLRERSSTEEIMECEREIWKSEIHSFVRRGDVCWNTAAGYKANQGKLIHDGTYLRELQVLWDPVGHLPEWLNMFMLSPSFYHHMVRSSNSNPVFYLDLTDFKDQVQGSLNLCQDKFEFATCKAARRTSRYRVQRWVYRALIEIKPGRKTGVLEGVDDLQPGEHAEGVIHPGWKGKIVIEVEGTTEKARDLIDRCTKAKLEEFVPPHQLSSFHFSNKEERQKIARSMRQGQLTPWKIVRERSSPGQIWIQALYNPDQADFTE